MCFTTMHSSIIYILLTYLLYQRWLSLSLSKCAIKRRQPQSPRTEVVSLFPNNNVWSSSWQPLSTCNPADGRQLHYSYTNRTQQTVMDRGHTDTLADLGPAAAWRPRPCSSISLPPPSFLLPPLLLLSFPRSTNTFPFHFHLYPSLPSPYSSYEVRGAL